MINIEKKNKRNWERAHLLFQCVAAASRPLRVKELAEFLAFDFKGGSIPTFQADRRSEDPVHAVLSACSCLLAVVDVDGSPVVAEDTISRFYVSITQSHTIVAQACLGVLLHLDEVVTWCNLENFPLAEYAAEYLEKHAQIKNVSSNVQDGINRLFDKRHLSAWISIEDPEYSSSRGKQSEYPAKARVTPLHCAAFCGMPNIATLLIVRRSQDVNAQDIDMKETPLHMASRCGHAEMTQVLLNYGAGMEVRDSNDWSPLELASAMGHVGVAKVLLLHGADVNAGDRNMFTPLHFASLHGQLTVARLLLDHGADPNASDIKNRTPLHLASERGHVRAAQILLYLGADVNTRDTMGRTPFMVATESLDRDIMQLLLEHGAEDHRM